MTRPVSIVIPAGKDLDLFERHIPPLMSTFGQRSQNEVIVVDDTGEDILRPWFVEAHPTVRGVVHSQSRGLGKSLLSGIRRAKHDLVFCMTPDILVRDGALQSLADALEDEEVFAVSPRLIADEASSKAVGALRLEHGALQAVGHDTDVAEHTDLPIACVSRAAFMARRKDLLEHCELDELFAPLEIEPLDLCLQAWRSGRRVVEVASSVVEHHPRHPEDEAAPARMLVEKNRLLALWKHMDGSELGESHVLALHDSVKENRANGGRELHWFVTALAQLGELSVKKSGGTWPIRSGSTILAEALSASVSCACETSGEPQ